ncbi:alkaline phosphatase, partial [Brucella sp. 21LCYQ03]|nr:alkaline phosphatase [Brucella sp. 21LCYQ03]
KVVLMADKGTAADALTYAIDRKREELTLQQITASAIQTLQKDNDKGFFLMVEGGKIDWACHSNDGATAIQETKDFDAAVAEAFRFYEQHPEETLILVTADHETGGMVLGNGSSSLQLSRIQHQKVSQGALSKKISDLRKANPNATWVEVKQLLEENTGLWKAVKISETEENELKEAYTRSFVQHQNETEKSLYAIDDRIAALAVKALNRASSISWASGNHSAAYIPIYAIGVGADLFHHKMDNIDIPRKIAEAAEWPMALQATATH